MLFSDRVVLGLAVISACDEDVYKRQRESGDVAGSAGCKLVGPAGEVEIGEGVIIAKRHIHMTPADAAAAGVADKDIVKVVTGGNGRKPVSYTHL